MPTYIKISCMYLQRDSGARCLVHGMHYASNDSIEPVRLASEGATTSQYGRIASAGLVVARPTTLHPAERPDLKPLERILENKTVGRTCTDLTCTDKIRLGVGL